MTALPEDRHEPTRVRDGWPRVARSPAIPAGSRRALHAGYHAWFGQFLAGGPARRAATRRTATATGRRHRKTQPSTMSVSSPFIHRPIATSLLGVAVMLGGVLGYWWLPVSALPQVDFPTIQVTTQLPGANPDTIAALVTAPLERQFGADPGAADDDLVEFVRHQPGHAAVRPQSRHRRRRAGRAVGDQRRRPRRCRATCPTRRSIRK